LIPPVDSCDVVSLGYSVLVYDGLDSSHPPRIVPRHRSRADSPLPSFLKSEMSTAWNPNIYPRSCLALLLRGGALNSIRHHLATERHLSVLEMWCPRLLFYGAPRPPLIERDASRCRHFFSSTPFRTTLSDFRDALRKQREGSQSRITSVCVTAPELNVSIALLLSDPRSTPRDHCFPPESFLGLSGVFPLAGSLVSDFSPCFSADVPLFFAFRTWSVPQF